MNTYVVGVSGGVDSVVLLHKLIHDESVWLTNLPKGEIIVAHFDHGIRDDSADDAIFVQKLAEKYGLEYTTKREELGVTSSEEMARRRRYAFLSTVAQQHDGLIMTAHHADDLLETVAINCQRGTGWRGLAVLGRSDVWRPLLSMRKKAILQYAAEHNLQWREDSTNSSQKYLRNRMRAALRMASDDSVEYMALLRSRQAELRDQIEAEGNSVLPAGIYYPRHLFISIGSDVAVELLRHICLRHLQDSLTIKQRQQMLHAIKTLHSGRVYEISNGITLRFTKTEFIVEVSR